jgi:ABC-type sulfate transport system substrate-binding protein
MRLFHEAGRLRHHAKSEDIRRRTLAHFTAQGYALKQPGGNEASATEFLRKLYKNAPVPDSGARGATATFIEHGIGDVLIARKTERSSRSRRSGQGRNRGAVRQRTGSR